MPYVVDHKNKCVYKKKSDGSRGEKVGCTKGDLKKYLAALHANDPKEAKKALNEIKQVIKENQENIIEAPVVLQNNITFWVVEKSKDPMDDPMQLFFETDPIGFANQIRGGLLPEEIEGFYLTEDEANSAAHDQVTAVYERAKGLEEKKVTVSTKLQKKIDKLQREVNSHLKAAKDDPDNADTHQTKAEEVLAKIRDLRGKHKMVDSSKKELGEREDIKKNKK